MNAVGGGTCTVSVEQRVPRKSDRGEPNRRHAHHVSSAVPCLEGALEPGHLDSGLQRPQDIHGDERHAV